MIHIQNSLGIYPTGFLSPGIKRPESEADHSASCTAECTAVSSHLNSAVSDFFNDEARRRRMRNVCKVWV
jgi:hypothetical protein